MVEGFNSGVDFHCFVAALLFNKEKVDKKDPLRTPTKTLNFGRVNHLSRNKTHSIQ
jgi:DNA polymerase I-like protein with 3'-5' exonuclease and polymerase domains